MPELRIDPITGRRVYIAEDRAGRPSDYATTAGEALSALETPPTSGSSAHHKSNCPFCAGNEIHTPVAAATLTDADGRWRVRVVPNKYPAVQLAQSFDDACGVHEVIIESPEHLLDVSELGPERMADLIRIYRDRLRHWAADPRLRHGLVFKNSGCDAGASLEHIHSQLVAVPYVLPAVETELASSGSYFDSHGRCLFCDLAEREIAAGERIIARRDGYVAAAVWAPRQPYEAWIVPERHQSRFDQLDDAELAPLARLLHETLQRLLHAEPGCPYNLLLHSAPFSDDHAPSYHWHWEVVPRLAHDAGLEWGGGVTICPLAPENAARRLRAAESA